MEDSHVSVAAWLSGGFFTNRLSPSFQRPNSLSQLHAFLGWTGCLFPATFTYMYTMHIFNIFKWLRFLQFFTNRMVKWCVKNAINRCHFRIFIWEFMYVNRWESVTVLVQMMRLIGCSFKTNCHLLSCNSCREQNFNKKEKKRKKILTPQTFRIVYLFHVECERRFYIPNQS